MPAPTSRLVAAIQFLAIVFVAVCLIPAGAHFFEMARKMSLDPTTYMAAQTIYSGWALFGVAILGALILTAWHAFLIRGNPTAFVLSLAALVLLVATQAIFWTYTYPMNVASQNWTVMPPDFETARRQWEYSHAVNAVLTFAAFAALTLSVVLERRPTEAQLSAD